MNAWLQTKFPSPACPLCHYPVEDFDHLVFACPLKIQAWQKVWRTFFVGSVDLNIDNSSLKQAIFQLQFPPPSSNSLAPSHFASLVIGFTLQSIWRAYWKLIFDAYPFSPELVSNAVLASIHTANQESFVAKGIPHRPLPPLPIDDLTYASQVCFF